MPKVLVAATMSVMPLMLMSGLTQADPMPKQQALNLCAADPNPATELMTPAGENDAEKSAKAIAFKWNCTSMVSGDADRAFQQFVSKDFCDHSHLLTSGQRRCGDYDETLANFKRMAKQFGGGPTIEVPAMAAVNGEIVAMYGEGIDLFRVHEGRLTDHWDASPPAEVTIRTPGARARGVLVDQKVLTAVDVGPMTPYAETWDEAFNKRTVFAMKYTSVILGQDAVAFDKYVSASYCDHTHASTSGSKSCASREEVLASAAGHHVPAKLGDVVDLPYMATVDGEMVTTYGTGVDVYRVQDGKITDHWDLSAPKEVTVRAHSPQTVEHMILVLAGKASAGPPPGAGAQGGPPTGR